MTNDKESGEPGNPKFEDAVTETRAEAPSPRLPKKIGPFHIKGILASGGMGVVYRAVQNNPRRTVAVKVMKRGIASRSAMRRFEYESQVLARLRHPGIAQIFEAGIHDDGTCVVPYFAMEYIPNAKPITQFAKEKNLGTRERLQMFMSVCDAIHHGHQKGIIHRDLKPDNIMVDPAGDVKIIDFGVARGTDSDLALTTLQTDVGQLVGTLQYMSPEQCEADPSAIDARSDVYALGVVLYELVAGQLPYTVSKKHIFDGTQVIREHQPTKLSTINKTLRGDVETIVLKALEKDPARRYQSATDFAHDISSYLSGEAIAARPASAVYQIGLYARRNRAKLSAVALVVLIAVIASVLVLQSQDKVARAEDAIAAALRRATAAERSASASRAAGVPANVRAEDLIGRTSLQFSLATREGRTVGTTDFAGSEATVLNFVAMNCPFCLMQIPKAEPIRSEYESRGVRFVNIIETMLNKKFTSKEAFDLLTRLGSKIELAMDVENKIGRLFKVNAFPIMIVLNAQGKIKYVNRGNSQDLAARLRGQLDSILFGIPTPADRLAEAGELLRQTFEDNRRTLGEGHRDTLRAKENLAVNLAEQGKHEEAEKMYRQIWTVRDRILGESDPQTLASMQKLGEMLENRGKSAEAESIHRQTLGIRRRVLGDDHLDTRLSMAHLGLALNSQGKTEGARSLVEELIELKRKATLVQDVQAGTLNDYSWLLLTCEPADLRDAATALPIAEEAVRLSGRQDQEILDTLALAQRMTGDLQAAIATQREALALIPLSDFRERWDYEESLVESLKEAGDLAGVEQLYRDKLAVQRATFPPGSPGIGFTLGDLGKFLIEQKRYSEAEVNIRECLDILRKALPKGNRMVMVLEGALGVALAGQGRVEEGNRLMMGAFKKIKGTDGVQPKQLREMLERVIKLYTEQGKPEEADKYRAMMPAEDAAEERDP